MTYIAFISPNRELFGKIRETLRKSNFFVDVEGHTDNRPVIGGDMSQTGTFQPLVLRMWWKYCWTMVLLLNEFAHQAMQMHNHWYQIRMNWATQ